MCDAVLNYSSLIGKKSSHQYWSDLNGIFGAVKKIDRWYLATIHRAENTDSIDKIVEILNAFEQLDAPVIFSIHPRTMRWVEQLHKSNEYHNILFVEPMGYLDMLFFTRNAIKVVADSGGLQKKSYILNTPCITVRDQTEWVETLKGNYNILAKPNSNDIFDKVMNTIVASTDKKHYYGEGNAARKICDIIENFN